MLLLPAAIINAGMTLLRLLSFALCATMAAAPALADPTTYRGKLGTIDIVVELSSDPQRQDGPVFGRYFYLNKGIDIPLQAVSRKGATIVLAEEEPCGADTCGEGGKPPVGGVWTLKAGAGGKLAGTWKGKREFRLELAREGSRFEPAAPKTPLDLFGHSEDLGWNGDPIGRANEPYDYWRMQVVLERSRAQGWPDARFDYAVDPRTKFAMPRIVELAGASPDIANAALEQRHWRHNLSAFGCAALQYAGFNENGTHWSTESGTLGGYEDLFTEVHAVTPRLASWQESGSLWCGGAHPYNFINRFTLDIASGEELALEDMFADAADGRPGETLAAFVRDTREKPASDVDIEFEAECGTDELIGEFLAASLRREGNELRIVFGLEGLPHVINACGDDVLELPAASVRHLLTPRFAALLGL